MTGEKVSFNCKVVTHWDLSYLVASDIATFWLANKMVYKNFSEKISTPFMHNQSKSFLSSICTDPVIVWLLVSPTLWSLELVVFVLKFPITPRFSYKNSQDQLIVHNLYSNIEFIIQKWIGKDAIIFDLFIMG